MKNRGTIPSAAGLTYVTQPMETNMETKELLTQVRQLRLNAAHLQIEALCMQYLEGTLLVNDIIEAMDKIHLPCVNGLLDPNTGLRYPD
jgi:hypothetical protein